MASVGRRAEAARSLLAIRRRLPVRRIGWGVIAQGLSSVTNFEIALLIARQSDLREFGTFGIGLSLYIALLWISRSLCTEPFAVRFAAASPEEQRAQIPKALGAALAVGITAGFIVAAVGLLAEPSPPAVLGSMALAMPLLLLQDAYRSVLIATRRARSAGANDLTWLITQTALAAILIGSGRATAATLTIAFGAGAGVGAVLGARQVGALPSLAAARHWLHDHRDLAVPFALELVAVAVTLQLALLGVAAISGPEAVGAIRAALLLVGPLTVLFAGMYTLTLPEAARLRERSGAALRRFVVALGVSMPAAALAWSGAVLLLPDSVGELVLGSNWAAGRELLPAVAVLTAGNACALAAVVGLRTVGAAKQSLRARLRAAPVILLGGAIGAVAAGARGAGIGLAAGSFVDVTLVWMALRQALPPGRFTATPS